jgi:hypothetical protein
MTIKAIMKGGRRNQAITNLINVPYFLQNRLTLFINSLLRNDSRNLVYPQCMGDSKGGLNHLGDVKGIGSGKR